MKCHDIKKRIIEYIDGELNDPFAKKISEHLKTCSACRQYEQHLRLEIMAPLTNATRHEPSDQIWLNILSKVENRSPLFFIDFKNWTSLIFNKMAMTIAISLIVVGGFVQHFSSIQQKISKNADLNTYLFNRMEILDNLCSKNVKETTLDFGTSIEHVFFKVEARKGILNDDYLSPNIDFGTSLERYLM